MDEFFTNMQKMLQLKMIMNQEFPYFLPMMNVSRPLCSTGILPYANISKVRTEFDHYFDTLIMINMLKSLL
jgi:hypothetical protein